MEALLAVSSVAAVGACQDPPRSDASADRHTPAAAGSESSGPAAPATHDTDPEPAPAPDAGPQDPEEARREARFARIDGDPPFVDGYNPEEATCPSGNWCGAPQAVAELALPHVEDEMGCPGKISGSIGARNGIEGKVYDGLSKLPSMQGTFNVGRTVRRRDAGDETVCCYHWFEYCSGRPLLAAADRSDAPTTRQLLPPTRPGTGWSRPDPDPQLQGPGPDLTPDVRSSLAQLWLHDARTEHASIAAFNRLALELMALGAPHELLTGCQRAALDEIDHARRCFALAGAYSGQPVEAGPLRGVTVRATDLGTLVRETFVEGCLGETVAALAATRAATVCRFDTVRADLEQIANDETRHAALAWAIVRWALRAGGESARRELMRAVAEVPVPADGAPDFADRKLRVHGRLGRAGLARARRDAWLHVVEPMARALLDPVAT